MLYLTRMLGKPVVDAAGETIGIEDDRTARGGLGTVQEAGKLEGAGVGPQGVVIYGHQGDGAGFRYGRNQGRVGRGSGSAAGMPTLAHEAEPMV